MRHRTFIVGCLLLAVVLVAAGCASSAAPAPTPAGKAPAGYESIRMVGSSIGSTATTTVLALAKILNKYYPEIQWGSSSGLSATNVIYVTNGAMKLGMVIPPNYIDAYGADKVSQSRVRSITIPVPVMNYTFFIPQDKPWKDITQVPKGTSISPGPPGTGLVICAEAWVKSAGLTKEYFNWLPMGKAEMADAWRTGKIDVGFANIDSPAPWLLDIATSPRKPKLMGLTQAQVDKVKAEGTFERLGFLPPEMTNAAELVPEVFSAEVYAPKIEYYLTVRDDFPEDVAYKMAKVIDERHDELTQTYRGLSYTTPQLHIKYARAPMQIHPGVARYYKEKGYLK